MSHERLSVISPNSLDYLKTLPLDSILLQLHIYQPPRKAFHEKYIDVHTDPLGFDWTDKIVEECYLPLAKKGILSRVSFDINGVLMSHFEKKYPALLAEIRRDTEFSMNGTSYIHDLLPDLTDDEKRIIIGAGVERFKKDQHGRKPYVFWPPETGMDMATAEILADYGYKAFLCAPEQVKIPDYNRSDNIPTWIQLKKGRKIIAIPFDRKFSAGLGFEDKSNAENFLHRLIEPAFRNSQGTQLYGATDGETFGHHWKDGDQFLEYLINNALPDNGYNIIHSGHVDITKAPVGTLVDRTAWSCHCGDLKRWHSGCACADDFSDWKVNYYQTFYNLNRQISQIVKDALGRNYVSTMIKNFETALHCPGPSEGCTTDESLLAAGVSALTARTSCATFFNNTYTSGLINILFGHVAIQHLRDSGRIKQANQIEAKYWDDLSRTIAINDKWQTEPSSRILERMLENKLSHDIAPAMLGLYVS